MAKALERRFWQLRAEAREVSRIGCFAAYVVRSGSREDRIETLDNAQTYLRVCLLEAEEAISDWRDRDARRARKLKAFRKRYGPSAAIGEHLRLAKLMEQSFSEYRQMIRQLGDALAWAVLRENPRIITPLYGERSHHLTPDVSLSGPAQVIIDAHKSGDLLVVDNDLTRCLGSGDLTVVASDGRWSMPLSIECKTATIEGNGGAEKEVSINMGVPLSQDPLHKELHEKFCRAVGANIGRDGRPVHAHEAKQESEMQERAELVFRALLRRPELLADKRTHWKTLQNVISRADTIGGAFDFPERGLAFIAVRNRQGDDATKLGMELLERLQEDGFPKGEAMFSLGDFAAEDRFSSIVPPIALWPIPPQQRIALLTGDIFLACVYHHDLWDKAFAQFELTAENEGGSWVVRGKGVPVMFDPIEKMKLRLGIAFSGVSPQAVAEAIAAVMVDPAYQARAEPQGVIPAESIIDKAPPETDARTQEGGDTAR